MAEEEKQEQQRVDDTPVIDEQEAEDLKGTFVDESEKDTDETPAETPEVKKDEEGGGKLFDQESANKAFIKNKKKLNAEREAREKAEKEAAEAKAKLEELAKGSRPIIPEPPAPYDDDYEAKLQEWKDASIKAHDWDMKQKMEQDQAQKQAEAQAQAKAEADKVLVDSYNGRIKELGLSNEEMMAKENIVNAYVNDMDLARFVVGMDDGPLVVSYLADNPMELEKIAKMPALNAAAHIAKNVLPNAQKLKPETTQTPEPLTIPDGKGAEKESPYMKGGKFL